MLSSTLVQKIEDHSQQITNRVIRQIQHDPKVLEIKKLLESELRDRTHDVLKNLGHWLAVSSETELAKYYEKLGRERFEQSIPLHEVVRCFQILKDNMIDFVREQEIKSSVELYAEQELQRQVGGFFDRVVYHLVRGYEDAMRKAGQPVS